MIRETTGKNELKTVNHVFKNNDPELTYLTLERPGPSDAAVGPRQSKKGSNELITTTPEHPFYVSSSKIVGPQQGNLGKNWVGAGHLESGDKIRTADGSSGIVLSVVNVVQPRVMFNLEVDGNHDFFVGENGWLVHNCPDGDTIAQIFTGRKKQLEQLVNGNKIDEFKPNGQISQHSINDDEVKNLISNTFPDARISDWQKVYQDGFDGSGNRVSFHYFTDTKTGQTWGGKIKNGWSNPSPPRTRK